MEEELHNSEEEKEDNKGSISSDLIRGHINTIILRTLYERDKYGYEIMEEIEAKSHGQYTLKQPTLYSALKRLESQGYITAYWKTDEVSNGGRRKYYSLTESGKEITEKNQSEWEYSRTVIDSLISDKNFDFTQPPPTAVDFKILKSSTSRVPIVKDDEKPEEVANGSILTTEVQAVQSAQTEPANQTTVQSVKEQHPQPQEAPAYQQQPQPIPVAPETKPDPAQTEQSAQSTNADNPAPTPEQLQEERRIHENYLKLISEPVKSSEDATMPYSDNINTERLIYNNKPETERDYRNLIDNLYVRTVNVRKVQAPDPVPPPPPVNYDDATEKASNDGLKVGTADYVIKGTSKTKYNRGNTLVKCSLIVAVIMLVEFALSLAFQKTLEVTIGYPVVILTLALAQVLICLILTTTEFGKSSRKPTSNSYLTATIIIAIIVILIIFVTSLLLNVNFAEIHDIMAKIIIPGIVALNIPIFATLFYIFSK